MTIAHAHDQNDRMTNEQCVRGVYAGSYVPSYVRCCNKTDKKNNGKNKHAINIMHFN